MCKTEGLLTEEGQLYVSLGCYTDLMSKSTEIILKAERAITCLVKDVARLKAENKQLVEKIEKAVTYYDPSEGIGVLKDLLRREEDGNQTQVVHKE